MRAVGPGLGVVVSVAAGSGFTVGTSRVLFKAPGGSTRSPMEHMFAVAPGDQRFLFLRPIRSGDAVPVATALVVPNWLAEIAAQLAVASSP